MAFGFGFNKTRSLASAEKYVQQGKIQNAIAEYEKIAREDPKDITVVNTIGDLYSRLGQSDKAVACFRRVGDQYASEGYTLKAIAMYKKLAKLSADDRENAQKLADLYTQQGLYNEARSQYMNLAEQHLRANESGQAIKIFQKMLDVDPENVNVQGKLADLLFKAGRPEDAKLIYAKAARAQWAKGANDAAKATLEKLLKIDPNYSDGLLLQGVVLAENGNYAEAAAAFEKVPNIDSVREGLVALLQAYLSLGDLVKADPVARKLFAIHHEVSGLARYAEALLQNGKSGAALEVYDRNLGDFLSQDPTGLLNALQSSISLIKDSAPALETLRGIYRKAGENTFNNEVMELLAHAYVQEGKMDKAAELYRELSIAEPDNPLHSQNYRQIVARLGNDPVYKPPRADEGTQAFMIEEMEITAQAVPQQHAPEINSLIRAALTDSELFSSYNLPEKAIGPLENALPEAPRDIQINQRLAVLYAKTKRYEQAADRCLVLSQVYSDAGHQEEAQQYANFASRYRATPATEEPLIPSVMEQPEAVFAPANSGDVLDHSAIPQEFQVAAVAPADAQAGSSVNEFEFEVVPTGIAEELPVPAAPPGAEPDVEAPAIRDAPSAIHEIDLSSEWEDVAAGGDILETASAPADSGEHAAELSFELLTVEEGSPHEMHASPMAEVAASEPQIEPAPPEVWGELQVAGEESPAIAASSDLPEKVEEASFYLAQGMIEEARAAIEKLEQEFPGAPEIAPLREQLGQVAQVQSGVEQPVANEVPLSPPSPGPPALEGDLLELASAPVALDDAPLLIEVPFHIEHPESASAMLPEQAPVPEAPVAEVSAGAPDFLSGLAAEVESALGDMATAKSDAVVAEPAQIFGRAPVEIPAPPKQLEPGPKDVAASVPARASAPPASSQPADMLSDLFSEFKEEVEDQTASEKDLDTHYNLGVAFREMGLLDEAIGELQTVCNSIDRGVQFDQTIQAYTWLAQCLVDKGFPEAAVRWYERALKIPRIDPESLMAIYYDLATAYEKAGNQKAAADNFMHVYSMNIDYRDVAERVKAQKS